MDLVIKNNNNKWWQLFKTGKHISSNGKEFNADSDKIDKIINATINHSYANDEIPICIGHKKDDSPKWGAFKKDNFKRVGEYLVGKYEYLVTEFAEYINRKMFDKVSIALYPDLAIKHIALLGAQAPAVKGLEAIEMNEPGESILIVEFPEFSEYVNGNSITGILKNIKAFLEKKFNPVEAESIIPAYLFREINNTIEKNNEKKYSLNKNKENNMPGKTTAQVPQEFSEKISVYEKEIAELKLKLIENEIKEFCESPEMAKKITPALMPLVKQIYMDLSAGAGIDFSEAENEGTNKQRLEPFLKILSALPDSVQFSEFATKEKAGVTEEPAMMEFSEMTVNEEAMELHRKALKVQSENKCSYLEAVRVASRV